MEMQNVSMEFDYYFSGFALSKLLCNCNRMYGKCLTAHRRRLCAKYNIIMGTSYEELDANFNEKALITYEVYNALGKVALQGNFTNSKPYQINTESMANGLYLLKVVENGKIISNNKVSIKH